MSNDAPSGQVCEGQRLLERVELRHASSVPIEVRSWVNQVAVLKVPFSYPMTQ